MKKAYFYIDDVIWVFRDLARQRPRSIYDNAFMKLLKEAHDRFGMKVQLNVFLRTDFFYGNDEFKLSEMPDCYKSEFEEASDWLKLGFHAKQEFPDYPYVNADYADVAQNLDEMKRAVFRFAGERSFARAATVHWTVISLEGCRALYDGGIRVLRATAGRRTEYNGDPSVLPYGHAARLLHNRKPEAMLFERDTRDTAIKASICSHNCITEEEYARTKGNLQTIKDAATGMLFKKLLLGGCLNLIPLSELETEFESKGLGSEFFGYATHEQYFYPDYFAYQPDYAETLLKAAEIMQKNGYEYFFAEEIAE